MTTETPHRKTDMRFWLKAFSIHLNEYLESSGNSQSAMARNSKRNPSGEAKQNNISNVSHMVYSDSGPLLRVLCTISESMQCHLPLMFIPGIPYRVCQEDKPLKYVFDYGQLSATVRQSLPSDLFTDTTLVGIITAWPSLDDKAREHIAFMVNLSNKAAT